MNISTSLKTLPLVPISIGRGQETGMVRMGGGGGGGVYGKVELHGEETRFPWVREGLVNSSRESFYHVSKTLANSWLE